MNSISPAIVTVVSSIIGLATVAVLVSKKAQTPQVFQSGGSALANILGAALSPVIGTSFGSNALPTGDYPVTTPLPMGGPTPLGQGGIGSA
jgi:hypothetical protein